MPHVGTLHDYIFDRDIDDIRGTPIYGINDEKLGKIDDVIFNHDTGEIKYAVVDTGGWFTHRKFLVPADRIRPYANDQNAFQIDLDKQRVESTFPKFDENILKSDPEWEAYEAEYKRLWQQDPVLHRADRIDLDITPPEVPEEVHEEPHEGTAVPLGSLGEEVHEYGMKVQAASPLNNEYPVDANPPANPTQQSKAHAAVGHRHPRMERFEDVLRKKRVDVTASCASCKPAKDRAA